jgi:diguanylate cyclase (GGDEF)-like protein
VLSVAASKRTLWFALALSAVVGLGSLLWRPAGLLAVVPVAAVGFVLLRERPRDVRTSAASGDGRLQEMVEALGSTSGAALQLGGGIHELLGSARRLFRAEYAEILVLPYGDALEAYRSYSTRAGERLLEACQPAEPDRIALDAIRRRGRGPVLVTLEDEDRLLVTAIEERVLTNAMIGVLRTSQGELGLAVVGNFPHDETDSSAADVTVFGTFCGHASVVLENARLGQSLEELMELKERLHHQAFHDALTGLPNRVLFVERVAAAYDRARSEEAEYGPTVLVLDLDGFKNVNDTWGHAAGDDLLVGVADRIRQAIRPVDTPARLGGDEFAILLDERTPDVGEMAAERIAMAFAEPFTIREESVVVRPSVGIAVAERGVSAEQLLRNADVAMYAAKADEVRHMASYEADTHRASRRRRELSLELDGALRHHGIELRFQPVVALADGTIRGFESLVRWAHPHHGLMSPSEFLTVADNRQLAAIGQRVMWEACRHACLWQSARQDGRRTEVWINLSAVDLTSDSLVDEMMGNVTRAKLDPTVVTLEITETSVIVGEQAAIENVSALRHAGIRIAIDDFGTGYSSLSRLGDFPLDMLKIPMPFVDRISDDQADRRLVDAIVSIARSLELGVVAEGVEREVQARVLAELGCELAQGYHYAPPVDGDTVLRLLRSGISLPHEHGFNAATSRYWSRGQSAA